MELPPIPDGWPDLQREGEAAYFSELAGFLAREYIAHTVYPPAPRVFEALERTPLDSVKVVVLGQDPYHGPGQAHGLAFSVLPGVKPPPSLANLLRELRDDLGCPDPGHGCLAEWADRGVLLLNTVLTVRAGEPGSHARKGWERFTDGVIASMNAEPRRVVFILFGAQAQKRARRVDTRRHAVIAVPHPSPLSAYRGFFGSRIFSRANARLAEAGVEPVDWSLRPIPAS